MIVALERRDGLLEDRRSGAAAEPEANMESGDVLRLDRTVLHRFVLPRSGRRHRV